MEAVAQEEREARAARNQALFRSVNERLEDLNEAFTAITGTFTIACECADTTCVQMIEVDPDEYSAVRAEPRQFLVRPGHVFPDVESVVSESDDYVVVEKFGEAGDVADALSPRSAAS
jgi:hypothetical protein